MNIEYDTEDRCIRVDDVVVSHGEAERLMNEYENAVTALETPWCGTSVITPRRTTLMDTEIEIVPELADALRLLGWTEL